MKLAFVAHSHGNLAMLEQALITLVDRFEATRVFALESAAYDAEAVVRARRQRFPAEVEWRDQNYPDFVLASVLGGVVQAPTDAVALTERIAKALTISPRGGDVVDLEGRTIGIGVTSADPSTMAAVVLPAVARRQVSVDSPPARIAPGHLRDRVHDGEPACCLIVGVVNHELQAQYVSPTGDRLGPAVTLTT
ncbi:MAG: hypothetical protein ACI9U2_001979 [Bradymonadia bacterium]|jgi:hypothetical protein